MPLSISLSTKLQNSAKFSAHALEISYLQQAKLYLLKNWHATFVLLRKIINETDQNIFSGPFQYLLQHAGLKKRNFAIVNRNIVTLQTREIRTFRLKISRNCYLRKFRFKKIIFFTKPNMFLSHARISMSSASQFKTLT